MKNGNIARIIILILFIMFIGLYLVGNSNYYDYEASSKTRLTESQIKLFEQDVEDGNAIDIENYLKLNEKNYNNRVSDIALNISTTISRTFDKALNYMFKKIDNAMNSE